MKRTLFFSLGLALAAVASVPAMAQQRSGALCLGRGVNPSMSLSAPSTTPLQAQMQDNYATQLQAEQRTLLQQQPSGTTHQEIAIGHALNGFIPH